MLLNGTDIAGYIKQRQFETVRSLQHIKTTPHLVIVNFNQEVVSSKYMQIKQKYGEDIGVNVSVKQTDATRLETTIEELNQDPLVHGIIVQLPLPAFIDSEKTLNLVEPAKDVDGLGVNSPFDPAAPTAILWLLGGYDISLADKKVVVVGQGRLIGRPLTMMLRKSGITVETCDENTDDNETKIKAADIVILATGQPELISSDSISPGTVVIDAGTAVVGNKLVGDADPMLYKRRDIKISPVPGGVGPLTVCVLFENVILAFKQQVQI